MPRTMFDLYDSDSFELWAIGSELVQVHPKWTCDQRVGCPIHGASPHHMADWPLHFDVPAALVCRICKHDVPHPDPDALRAQAKPQAYHVCDCKCCLLLGEAQ